MENSASQNQANANFQYKTQEQIKEQTDTQIQQQRETVAPSSAKYNFSFKKQDELEKELRKPRSRAYMEIFDAIDMLSTTDEEIIAKLKESMDEETFEEFSQMSAEELIEEIMLSFQEEFKDKMSELIGVISKCYIPGCDCHAISPEGAILEHFEALKPLPPELKKGRDVFRKYPDCKCVEVYSDCCRVVNYDSTVVKIKDIDIF